MLVHSHLHRPDRNKMDRLDPVADTLLMYLDLLKRCLLGMIYEDPPTSAPTIGGYATKLYVGKFRETGRDVPSQAHSMIGLRRMDDLQSCIEQVLADAVPGDLIETGVWRGGATIFMRGVLKAYGVTDRRVWVADSFAGLPVADVEAHSANAFWAPYAGYFAVDLETVRRNFARYELLDDQVQFLPGWFKDTLPTAPIAQLAVLRLDGDLYESIHDALIHLYPKLSPGGFVIVDDYNYESCRQAITRLPDAARDLRSHPRHRRSWRLLAQEQSIGARASISHSCPIPPSSVGAVVRSATARRSRSRSRRSMARVCSRCQIWASSSLAFSSSLRASVR